MYRKLIINMQTKKQKKNLIEARKCLINTHKSWCEAHMYKKSNIYTTYNIKSIDDKKKT